MNSNTILRIALAVVLVAVGFWLIKWVLGILSTVLSIAITVAVIAAVIWLIINVFTKKKSY